MNNTINPTLPIRNMDPIDFNGFLFCNCPDNVGFNAFILEMQGWITCNWAADIRKEYERLMETGKYHWTKEELDEYEKDEWVISPVTLFAYESYLEKKRIGWDKMKGWERERHIMDLHPGRFSARYKINVGYANAKKVKTPEEIEDEEFEKMLELQKKNDDEIRRFVEEEEKRGIKEDGIEGEKAKGLITFEEDVKMLLNLKIPNDACCEQMILWHKM